MKKLMIVVLLFCSFFVFAYDFGLPPRRAVCSDDREPIPSVVLIRDVKNADMDLALSESKAFLTQVMGAEPEVASSPVAGKFSIVLGNGPLAQKAGIKNAEIPQEGFVIRRKGDVLYIAGDESSRDRGTLNGVYEFFERFCDARFYFPGKHGTLIPRNRGLVLPTSIDILDRPDYSYRHLVLGSPQWYEKDTRYDGANVSGLTLAKRRWRDGSCLYPLIHSTHQLNLTERFGKSHPEYFALMPNGKRYNAPELVCTEHFCFNSGIRKEIEEDALAYFEGKPASARNILTKDGKDAWHWTVANSFRGKKFFGVQPNDYLYWCCCPACAKIAPGERRAFKETAGSQHCQAISNVIWRYAADIARSVKAHGHDGAIAMMAYAPYKDVPQIELPDNLLVQLAVTGGTANPDATRKADEFLNAWCKKLNSKVFIWTYPGKHMRKAIPGVPAMAHNRIGHWYSERSDRINGALLEMESDYWFFAYLNCYIFLRTAWNNDIDVDAVLNEHFQRLFCAGAAEMKQLYDELERLWCDKVVGDTMDSPLGPMTRIPADLELWQDIYSPQKLAELDALAAKAAEKCKSDKDAQERVHFAAEQLLGPLKESARQFQRNQDSVKDWCCHLGEDIHLRPYHIDYNEVKTTVTVTETPNSFQFLYRCEEPFMDKVKADFAPGGSWDLFRDSVVELFLNPSGDRKNYLHFYGNSKGYLNESKGLSQLEKMPIVTPIHSGATLTTTREKDGWTALFTIPKSALGDYDKKGFPVNFARNRALNGMAPRKDYKEDLYHWNPTPGRAFNQVERFGTLWLAPAEEPILKDGDFSKADITRKHILGNWIIWRSQKQTLENQPVELDDRIFISGGRSFHAKSNGGKLALQQKVTGLEPGKSYRLSFFVRTKDIPETLESGISPMLGWKNNGMRSFIPVSGTRPWHRVSVDFTAPKEKNPDGLWIYIWFHGSGEAWIDQATITKN